MLKLIFDEVKMFITADPLLPAVFALGAFFLVLGGNAVVQNIWGNYNTPIPAVVTRSEAFYRAPSNGQGARTAYRFEYEYVYNDQRYTSDRYSFRNGSNSAAVDLYRPGDQITAHLNPNRPNRAIVEKGLSWLNYVWIGFGLLLTGRTLQMHSWYRK